MTCMLEGSGAIASSGDATAAAKHIDYPEFVKRAAASTRLLRKRHGASKATFLGDL